MTIRSTSSLWSPPQKISQSPTATMNSVVSRWQTIPGRDLPGVPYHPTGLDSVPVCGDVVAAPQSLKPAKSSQGELLDVVVSAICRLREQAIIITTFEISSRETLSL